MIGKPGVLQSMGSQRVIHNLATEQQQCGYLRTFFPTFWFRYNYFDWRKQNLQLIWPAAAAKSLQSCLTLCDPIDGSPPGSPVPGILQVRTLEWVAISFSNAWKWKVKVKSLSRVRLLAIPWTAAYQAPLSMGFTRQEYCLNNNISSSQVSGDLWFKWLVEQLNHVSAQTIVSGFCWPVPHKASSLQQF